MAANKKIKLNLVKMKDNEGIYSWGSGGTVSPPPGSVRENLQINIFQMFKNAYLNCPTRIVKGKSIGKTRKSSAVQ